MECEIVMLLYNSPLCVKVDIKRSREVVKIVSGEDGWTPDEIGCWSVNRIWMTEGTFGKAENL